MTKPVGPYTPIVRAGDFLICSGQVGQRDGKLVDGDVTAQTAVAIENIATLLAQHGAKLTDVVKTMCFLVDMADFAAMNAVYAEVVSEPYPARSTVQAAGLPKGALVEIDAIALRSDR